MAINAGSVYSDLILDASKYEKALNKAEKQADTFSNNFAKVGKALVAAFSVKAIINFGEKIVQASADLQAMEAQFDQVFKNGENEKAVNGITKQVDDLGIHADRLTGVWSKFGGQVKGAGMESEQALQAVDKATRLAADSAAFYDVSLEKSSASLASFMKGNFEAGDAIGVFTNAKQMDVRSNEMYGKSWQDLTEAERQWLLLDTVEKTYEMNGAMGQAAREADSYENVMGNLRATFQRLWAVIGEPVLQGFLIIVQAVTNWIENNMVAIETTVKKIFEGIKMVWENVLKPVLTLLWDTFKNIVQWVQDNWPTISKIFTDIFNAIKKVWDSVLEPVLSLLWDILKGIIKWVADNWSTISSVFKTVFDAISWVWNTVLKPVLDALLKVFGTVVNFVSDSFPVMQRTVENVFSGIGKAVDTVTGIFERVTGAIKTAWNWLTKWNDTDAKDKNVSGGGRSFSYDGSHANGLDYVPFDGYIAQLHKGERVLTAEENRNGVGSSNVNNFNIARMEVRNDNDIKLLAQELFNLQQQKNRGRGLKPI